MIRLIGNKLQFILSGWRPIKFMYKQTTRVRKTIALIFVNCSLVSSPISANYQTYEAINCFFKETFAQYIIFFAPCHVMPTRILIAVRINTCHIKSQPMQATSITRRTNQARPELQYIFSQLLYAWKKGRSIHISLNLFLLLPSASKTAL